MQLLDGKVASQAIKDKLSEAVKRENIRPHLAAILVGNDGASETYVASKIRSCKEVGFESSLVRFEETVSEQELLSIIHELNSDNDVHGILVQLPLPKHISEGKVIEAIAPVKDVDCFHPYNVGKMVQGQDVFLPATPYGVLLMLQHYKINVAGKHAVVIGRSNIVGRPMSVLLSRNDEYGNATVTLCHSRSVNLIDICRQADILVVALGKPSFLTGDFVKEGAIVIDVGITRVADDTKKSGFTIKGDADFNSVAPKCSYITPVPGGVGLMTIAGLLQNTYRAYQLQQQAH
jgi:methylenetetrahydrofolate dehydrogenase (NADP+) / methenyltetrahydrofolate cyclohydrolase